MIKNTIKSTAQKLITEKNSGTASIVLKPATLKMRGCDEGIRQVFPQILLGKYTFDKAVGKKSLIAP